MSTSLPTLEFAALETVTGGKQVKGGSYGSSSNSELTTALTGLSSQIKDLSKPAQGSSLSGTNLMLFAMLAMNRPAPAAQTNVVYVRRRGCW